MMRDVWILAGVARKRLWRGRAIWVVGLLAVLSPLIAAWARAEGERWEVSGQFTMRVFVMIAAALLLASAVGEEIEAKTYGYLWSRPIARSTLILGKLVATVPVLLGLALLSMSLAFLGVGAIFPRHPFVFILGWFMLAETALSVIPNVSNLSILHHALVVGGIATDSAGIPDVPFSLGALFVQSALWLGVGLWRVSVTEYGRADT
jgi:hypothetical protein